MTEISLLWKISWPVLVGQVALIGMSTADIVMSGHASTAALAAVSIGSAIWVIAVVTVIGIMMAVNTLIAHEVGAQRHSAIPPVVRQALWKSVGVAVVGFALLNCSTAVLPWLQLEPDVERQAAIFVHVISIGMLPFSVFRVLYGYSAALSMTQPMMVISVVSLGLNILFNYIFIYGKFGFPALGGVGCAVGSVLGLWFNLWAMVVWIYLAPAYRTTFPFSRWERPNWQVIGNLLRIGTPIGVTYFAEASTFSLVGLLVARFGAVTIAAHSIALSFASLVFMVPMSLGIGLISRVGQLLGAGEVVKARKVSFTGVGLALAFGAVSAIFIALFRHVIASAYTTDVAVELMAGRLLVLAAMFQLSDATQVAAASAIRGYKVTRPPMLIHLASFWVIAIPLGCFLGLAPSNVPFAPKAPMAAEGFWIGFVVGLTIAAILLVWCLDRISLHPERWGVKLETIRASR